VSSFLENHASPLCHVQLQGKSSLGEGALHIEIGLYPSNYARMTAGAFRGIDPVGAFASLARLESPALARLTGIVESIRVIGDFSG
jgi:hypothetical protein